MAHYVGNVSLPSTVYSMLDIADAEKITHERMTEMMNGTIKRLKEAGAKTPAECKKMFEAYACNDVQINLMLQHQKLQPFAAVVKLKFESGFMSGEPVYYGMFYIPKKIYNNYRKYGTAEEQRAKTAQEFDDTPGVKKTVSLSIANTETYQYFAKSVKSLGFKVSDIAIAAIDEYMQNHKDIFGEVQHTCDEKTIGSNNSSLIWAYIDKAVTNKVWKTILRWNKYNTPPIKFSDFLEMALIEKLNSMPLKYTNPDKLAEFIKKETDNENR